MSIFKNMPATLLATVCLFAGSAVQAVEADKRSAGSPKQAVKAEGSSAGGTANDNAITQAIVKSGAGDCRARANQVVNYLTTGSQSGAFLFLPPQADGTKRLTSASLEVRSPQQVAYASASFAPVGSGRCDAVYDAVAYWNANCQEVAAKNFGQFKPVGAIKQNIFILEGGPQARVFLMPAGVGCVSIKKEVAY